ncbi:MAG TPA: VOC family protein, partial [Ktedonobacteraceae bacterium]|nr:VOC family protein [Ktedonobacteraceae bacterium]
LKNAPQKPPYRGMGVRRLDHVNMLAQDVTTSREWLQKVLGFNLRENLYVDDQLEGGSWLSVTSQVHDIAVMRDATGQNGRLHHVAYWLDGREDVLRAADILTDADIKIEAGPGKHGITQAFFLYLIEPGGNRVELFSGGYQIFAPDWQPVTWTKDEIEKSIIWWGSPLPEEYFIYGT